MKINLNKQISLLLLIFSLAYLNTGLTFSSKSIKNPDVQKKPSVSLEKEAIIKETYCTGKVIKIFSEIEDELPGGNKQITQQLLLEIIDGKDKGKQRASINVVPDNPAFAIKGEVGKTYLISKLENLENGEEDFSIIEYYRQNIILILLIVFLLVLLLVGGAKGLRAIISLITTILLFAFFMLPAIERGINPLITTIIVCFISTIITMVLVAGFNKKSLASTLGTLCGITISGLIATIVIKVATLSGLATNEAMILWGNQRFDINFKGLLASSMIISCLGGVMDVAISVASSIQEIKLANPKYKLKELFNSGMNVGKDIMGTMTNTLVLAYTGMALPLLLLISYEKNPVKFLNLELVVSEITAALSGSIGLILAIPATALIMAYLSTREQKL